MPPDEAIVNCFNNNPNGFGLAYWEAGMASVKILKGAMSIKGVFEMIDTLPSPDKKAVVLHFRLATNGDVSPENCHPFPISHDVKELQALKVDAKYALAHNGIIPHFGSETAGKFTYTNEGGVWARVYKDGKGLSDTQLFITKCLADFGKAIYNRGVKKLLESLTNSKFAILATGGRIELIGEFSKKDGIYYSNYGYVSSYSEFASLDDEEEKPLLPALRYSQKLKAFVNPAYYGEDAFKDNIAEKRYAQCDGCRVYSILDYAPDYDTWLCKSCLEYYRAVGDV